MNIVLKFYEWPQWEGILHHLLFALTMYAFYIFVVDSKERTLTNVLLFTVTIAINALLHQNINKKNKKETSYYLM